MTNNKIELIKKINNIEEKTSQKVFDLIEKKGINFPKGYDPQKAIANAFLVIKQDEKLYNCDQLSIAHSLLNMVTLGLDIEHNQVYLIPVNKNTKLTLRMSYFGIQTALLRIDGVLNITSQVIYEGDKINYDIINGNVCNFNHKTNFSNRDNAIIGAYSVIVLDEKKFGKKEHVEIMTKKELDQSWKQGYTNDVQKNFPQEMSKRTVIKRACKNFVNTITDNPDIANAYNEVIKSEYEEKKEDEIKEQDLTFLDNEVIEAEFEEKEFEENQEENEIIFTEFEEKEDNE